MTTHYVHLFWYKRSSCLAVQVKLIFTLNLTLTLNMHVGCSYSMNGQLLEETDSEKDQGVVFSDNLKVAAHCQEAYSKANRMLGLISRTIKYKNPEILLNLYKSMVRPHLDYCSTVWSTHYIKDKTLLERVQHRFTRLFPHLRSLPYEARLSHLGL